jgi:hypothetical protein
LRTAFPNIRETGHVTSKITQQSDMAMENTQIIDGFPIKTSIFIVDFPASHGSLPEGKCCVTLDFSSEKSTRTEGWGPEDSVQVRYFCG